MPLEENTKHTFLWRLENFSFLAVKKGERIDSPAFKAKNLDHTSWFIRVFPRGGAGDEDYLSCYLYRSEKDDGPSEISCEYEIQLINAEGNILSSLKNCYKYENYTFDGNFNFLKRSILSNSNEDILTIRCTLKTKAQKLPLHTETSCVTKIGLYQSSFKLMVQNLNSTYQEIIKFLNTWEQKLKISVQASDNDIKVKISRDETVTETVVAMCEITLLDLKGLKQDSRKDIFLFFLHHNTWEFLTFVKKSKLNLENKKYLKDDCFELQFEIKVSNGTQSHLVVDKECGYHATDLCLADTGTLEVLEDMKRLYKNKSHADVKLHVGGQIVKAHKSILSIRSPVFSAMFDSDMVENKNGSVTITDLEADTVNSLLEYIYIGTVEILDFKMAAKLIVAAEKYQVLSLKEKCANFIQLLLSNENVCDVCVVADLIQHEVLIAAAIKYIKNNSECIFLSEEWNGFVEKYLRLATEIVRKVSMLIAANGK